LCYNKKTLGEILVGGRKLKKNLFALAGAVTLATVICASACGEPVVYDKEAPALEEADVTLEVSGKKGAKISDSLFGVFLEDINYASYLLDDNLIPNGSFEAITANKDFGWTASGATLAVENSDGLLKDTAYSENGANVNPHYAKVTASAGGKLINTGYPAIPIAIEKDKDYVFSAFVKCPDRALDMTVKVTDGTTECLSGTVNLLQDGSWVKYARTFRGSATKNSNLKLELSFASAATVYLDGIALETTDSTVGVKQYAYDAIKELSPKFIRFPGGCIIEGNGAKGDEGAYDWKNSIGATVTGTNAGDDDVPALTYKVNTDGTIKDGTPTYGEAVTRKHNPDLWAGGRADATKYDRYYDMDYAIGFYDYFVLAESVGASAVPVLNCGLSCQGGGASNVHFLKGRHNKGVEDYIRDAVDLIEFAKGGTDTKWGKIRSLMGHPAPFRMDYLGIGNEQSGEDYYVKCYQKFLEDEAFMNAMKKYSVKPIVGNAMFFENCENPDKGIKGTAQKAAKDYLDDYENEKLKIDSYSQYGVVDQHYYVNYTELFGNTHLYDNYTRESENSYEYYEVFVGEYSANEGTARVPGYDSHHKNSWITALSEAAMMTGFERNGDVVSLAAYAPMFAPVNVADRQWEVDMMYFTNTRIVRSANYYVQQIFMKNQGSRVANSTNVEFKDGFAEKYALPVDTGSHATPCEIDKFYHVASVAENGDVIVKMVNACPDTLKVNIALSGFKLRGNADVTELSCADWTAVNSLESEPVKPDSFTIGAFSGKTIGYELKPYSVVAMRVHKK